MYPDIPNNVSASEYLLLFMPWTAKGSPFVQLEGVLHKLDKAHEDFRLWITTEPHLAFPIGILQMSIKVTNEAPVGMKAGLRASFQWITQVSIPVQQSCSDC